jgi:ElaB/YqjD/DUF883 family membrane-anchored ribosome-binding protein
MRRRRLFGELDELKDDVTKLREDTAAAVEKLIDVGREHAGETRDRIVDVAQRWFNKLSGSFSGTEGAGRKGLEFVQETVENRPVTSVLVALGVGFLVGRLLDRES